MHDLKWIRDNAAAFDEGLRRRGLSPMSAEILAADADLRRLQTEIQTWLTRRNEASRRIGALKGQGGEAEALKAEVGDLKERVRIGEDEAAALGEKIESQLATIPNLPLPDVPEGPDESANVELRRVGEPRAFAFPPQSHEAIGKAFGLMDFETASQISGARFVVLKGAFARLERALAAFMLDLHTNAFGYTEVSPPVLVREQALYGTGQLPKFADDLFRTRDDYWLIPTAEVPLSNLARERILDDETLPLRFTALTPCFRSEAGAAGRDTRGMIRQHQFYKVELVSITTPEQSTAEHERMTDCAEAVLRRLGLPYRVMLLSSGDMGFAAAKTYDIEVWLPSENVYREISSCSNCGDFQARRMKARTRPKGNREQTRFVHTLNGSGLAVGRTLIAVIENYQEEDGAITVPEALRPYLGGLARIEP